MEADVAFYSPQSRDQLIREDVDRRFLAYFRGTIEHKEVALHLLRKRF